MAAATRARDLAESDEATVSTTLKELLGDFPFIKEFWKEQKTCPVNSANWFREELDFRTVSTSSKSGSQL